MITRRQPPVKQNPQSFLHCRKIAENRRKTQKRCKFNLQTGCGLGRQKDLECAPRSAGKVTACLQRAGTLRWARGREGCSDSPLPTSGLHPPRNGQGAPRPFHTPHRKSNQKKSSRFAPPGCGAQRPLRALSGTRVLLTAAPTAPPCIRRWRRSSPLHFFLASPI